MFEPGAAPRPSPRRLAVRVTPDALRQIRAGHPWVYDGSIRSVSHQGASGDLAVVFDERRRFAAIGLWDPMSPIRLKVLHAGEPTPIGPAFWSGRLKAAVDRRRSLRDSETSAYRLVHGENDGLPGLVIDRYDRVAVMKLYSPAWIPHLPQVVVAAEAELGVTSIVLRLGRRIDGPAARGLSDGMTVSGPEPGDVVMFTENGLTFEADPRRGQKTGHFLDQRDNRLRLRSLCPASKVLDVFACTGGFGVNAALGGARLVHSVDSSAHALAACRRNMAHNRGEAAVRRCRHITTVGDAFATMAHLAEGHERYDVVVLDPPSFASRRTEAAGALRAYAGLTRLALRLLEPGGALVQASCSSQVGESDFFSAVHAAAGECSVRLVELERTGAPFDHPVTFLEGSYLKAMFARVQPDRKVQGG